MEPLGCEHGRDRWLLATRGCLAALSDEELLTGGTMLVTRVDVVLCSARGQSCRLQGCAREAGGGRDRAARRAPAGAWPHPWTPPRSPPSRVRARKPQRP